MSSERLNRVPIYLTDEEKEILEMLKANEKRSMSSQMVKLIREEALRHGIILK